MSRQTRVAGGEMRVTPRPPGCRTRCPRVGRAPPRSARPGRCRHAGRPTRSPAIDLGVLIVGRKSRWMRFLTTLSSGTATNSQFGSGTGRSLAARHRRPRRHSAASPAPSTTRHPARRCRERRYRSRRTSDPSRQLLLQHLAHRVAGQVVHQSHLPRPLVDRKLMRNKVDQLVRVRRHRRRTRRCADRDRRPARRSPRPRRTPGWPSNAVSISPAPTRKPPVLIRSTDSRPTMRCMPASSIDGDVAGVIPVRRLEAPRRWRRAG